MQFGPHGGKHWMLFMAEIIYACIMVPSALHRSQAAPPPCVRPLVYPRGPTHCHLENERNTRCCLLTSVQISLRLRNVLYTHYGSWEWTGMGGGKCEEFVKAELCRQLWNKRERRVECLMKTLHSTPGEIKNIKEKSEFIGMDGRNLQLTFSYLFY